MDQLPRWGKVTYGAGSAGWRLVDQVVITWLLYYYVSGAAGAELVSPVAFGALMLFGRIVDAAADPLVGVWSDNSKNRWGRRTPFMLAAGVLYVSVFVALFHPPVDGPSGWNTAYLAVGLGLYFVLFTVYVLPYLALLPELARTRRDRVDLTTLKALFTLLGTAGGLVASGPLIGALGFRGMVIVSGAVALVFLYAPPFIRERRYARAVPSTLSVRESVLATLRNRPFRIYLVGSITFWFGFTIATVGVPFYVTALLGLPEEATALYFGGLFLVAAAVFPVVNFLAKRWGLKAVMCLSMGMFVLLLPMIALVGRPVFGIPEQVFAFAVLGLAGIPAAGLLIVPDAIVAAVSDLDERVTGARREGIYFGTQGLIQKLAIGLSTFVAGALLQVFGQTPDRPLGVRLTGPVAAVFVLLGLLWFLRYPEAEVEAARTTGR